MPSAEGDLPPERLHHHQPPFTIGRKHEKRYGALFTCMTTRAVHIELEESLSTDEHARGAREKEERGRHPHHIMEIHTFRRSEHGERLVRSVKTALAATLRERNPREEVPHTLLLEAEHIINSRPLTDVDIEPTEPESHA
ncbi:hypothetical protein EVAR_90373_1 [Eumeta japonica]|uniref:Uncharacterized protein n=1 Tax=Eumeta variegata TaxID=151549 RepID=A0A4C1YAX8_EUMVA|nr:hypothetical protein EVAR_90373_1 [Eumeta japonica]